MAVATASVHVAPLPDHEHLPQKMPERAGPHPQHTPETGSIGWPSRGLSRSCSLMAVVANLALTMEEEPEERPKDPSCAYHEGSEHDPSMAHRPTAERLPQKTSERAGPHPQHTPDDHDGQHLPQKMPERAGPHPQHTPEDDLDGQHPPQRMSERAGPHPQHTPAA